MNPIDKLLADSQLVRRDVPLDVELRTVEGKPRMVGHAAVFNVLSRDLGGFKERILPGAFSRQLTNPDVVALFNHDANYPLGRVGSGTLRLSEDSTGLAVEIDPPDTTYARDLQEVMSRGDVNKMSFAFYPVKSQRGADSTSSGLVIERAEVRLQDVSPVVFPAYTATDISVRSLLLTAGFDVDRLGAIYHKRQLGEGMDDDDIAVVQAAIALLSQFITEEEQEPSEGMGTTDMARARLSNLRRRLELDAMSV